MAQGPSLFILLAVIFAVVGPVCRAASLDDSVDENTETGTTPEYDDGCIWSTWSPCEPCSITQFRYKSPENNVIDSADDDDSDDSDEAIDEFEHSDDYDDDDDNDIEDLSEEEIADANEGSFENDNEDESDGSNDDSNNFDNNDDNNDDNNGDNNGDNNDDYEFNVNQMLKRTGICFGTVHEERYCPKNCTRPATYWKINHYYAKDQAHNRPWPTYDGELSAEETKFPCARALPLTWVDIVRLPSSDLNISQSIEINNITVNNLWNALAKQYIAARMNERVGAEVSEHLKQTLILSRDLLHCDDVNNNTVVVTDLNNDEDRELANKLIVDLTNWNSGNAGVVDCRAMCTLPVLTTEQALDSNSDRTGANALELPVGTPSKSSGLQNEFSPTGFVFFVAFLVIAVIVVIVGITAGVIRRRRNARFILAEGGTYSSQGKDSAPFAKHEIKKKLQQQEDLEDIELGEDQINIKSHQKEDSEGDLGDEDLQL